METTSAFDLPQVDDTGATAVEYALLVALIALAIFATVVAVGGDVLNLYQDSCSKVGSATATGAC